MSAFSRFLAPSAILMLGATVAHAEVHPSALFSDNVVLQRGAKIPVFGTADSSEKVTVTLAGKSVSAVADAAGRWRVDLPPLPAGGPYTLEITGKNVVTAKEVLIGDVWICSGQSNMQYAMSWNKDYDAANIAASEDPQLRCFTVANKTSPQPLTELLPANKTQQIWQTASPQTLPGFTAVGYYFARELRKKLGVPIGIIHTAWGGTIGEAWVSREGLSVDPEIKTVADTQIRAWEAYPGDRAKFPPRITAWAEKYGATDTGDRGEALGWAKPEFDDSGWKTTAVPVNFSRLGMKSGGSVWFRKTLDFPAEAAGRAFVWNLNWSSDDQTAYLNGVKLSTPKEYPQEKFFTGPRSFMVPAGLVRAGKNTLVLRVFSHTVGGSVAPTTAKMNLPTTTFGTDADQWHYQVERENVPLSGEALNSMPKMANIQPQNTATYIHNAQIAPLMPFAIRGAIWYQGESNSQRALQYRKILPALIADWRSKWGVGDFPFYIVQLANYGRIASQPGRSGWAELREAQLLTAKKVPNTGLAVTIDIGEGDNIHPRNKQDVGKRLALAALAKTYGKKIPYSGPVYKSMTVTGGKASLTFDHLGGGLVARGGALKQFAIAGADNQFVWADARISGDTVTVSSPQVPNPVSVRYAWADNPEGANLYNAAGLPATPFRTNGSDEVVAPVPTASLSELPKSGILRNGSFTTPPVPADKTYLAAKADGWTYEVRGGGPAIGVETWKANRPPYLFWNGPDGTISQTADVKTAPVARIGDVYTLSYFYGGQGKGTYTLVASVLVDGRVVATDIKEVDVTKPGIDRTANLTYTTRSGDLGKSVGVSFSMTKKGDVNIQSALKGVSLTVAPSSTAKAAGK
ncbi:MAG: 9-O-acetylesterase [Cytophagales bacterium]|nr:9-O-acetylesterase [Armatimonadota bacterium]